MNKKVIVAIVAIATLMIFISASSTVNDVDADSITSTISDGTLTISGNGPIPDYTDTNKASWNGNKSITTIVIEDGITRIGDYAFHNLTNLTTITIPDSVTSKGICVFKGDTNLTNINQSGSFISGGIEWDVNSAL